MSCSRVGCFEFLQGTYEFALPGRGFYPKKDVATPNKEGRASKERNPPSTHPWKTTPSAGPDSCPNIGYFKRN